MHWILRVSVMTLALAALGAGASAQTQDSSLGKNADIELTQPAALGTIVLEPGHYRFTHVVQDGQHFVVAARQTTAGYRENHYGVGGGAEVARIPCDIVPLEARVKQTEIHFRERPGAPRAITQLRIRKEGSAHLIALEPKG